MIFWQLLLHEGTPIYPLYPRIPLFDLQKFATQIRAASSHSIVHMVIAFALRTERAIAAYWASPSAALRITSAWVG